MCFSFLLEGDCSVAQFTEAAVADSRRIALAGKVQVKEDPAITAKGARFRHMARVEVLLRNGERLECTREAPRGSEQDFAPAADIRRKFEQPADAARLADLMRIGV